MCGSCSYVVVQTMAPSPGQSLVARYVGPVTGLGEAVWLCGCVGVGVAVWVWLWLGMHGCVCVACCCTLRVVTADEVP